MELENQSFKSEGLILSEPLPSTTICLRVRHQTRYMDMHTCRETGKRGEISTIKTNKENDLWVPVTGDIDGGKLSLKEG